MGGILVKRQLVGAVTGRAQDTEQGPGREAGESQHHGSPDHHREESTALGLVRACPGEEQGGEPPEAQQHDKGDHLGIRAHPGEQVEAVGRRRGELLYDRLRLRR